jgi:putative hydrolase of the HAD superfamily
MWIPPSLSGAPRPMLDLIAFDADDTLWHNESLYRQAQQQLQALLSPYAAAEVVKQRLFRTEMRNLPLYGYGIKSFALSMIETAIELSEEQVSAAGIGRLLDVARAMLAADVQLFDHAEATLASLAGRYPLMLITKGDLRDQQAKLARSQIQGYFEHVEVVSEKTEQTYASLLERHGVPPDRFLMVGNSLRSDVLPVLALGAFSVYVPYHLTWMHEQVDALPAGQAGFYTVEHLGQLPALVEQLQAE